MKITMSTAQRSTRAPEPELRTPGQIAREAKRQALRDAIECPYCQALVGQRCQEGGIERICNHEERIIAWQVREGRKVRPAKRRTGESPT